MHDFVFTQLIQVGIISVFVLLLKICKQVRVNVRWSLSLFFIFVIYSIALHFTRDFISIRYFFPELQWNWSGKFAAMLIWAVVLSMLVKFKSRFAITDAGFTLKQNKNSIKPAIFVTVLLLALNVALTSWFSTGIEYDSEELLFQATMPGFDEEPMYRGIMLYMASLAIVSNRLNFLGANINFAGLLLSVLFGLIHGVAFSNSELVISFLVMSITGFYGFVFLWLRERTGSLIFPILAHNGANFTGQFF